MDIEYCFIAFGLEFSVDVLSCDDIQRCFKHFSAGPLITLLSWDEEDQISPQALDDALGQTTEVFTVGVDEALVPRRNGLRGSVAPKVDPVSGDENPPQVLVTHPVNTSLCWRHGPLLLRLRYH